MPDLPGFVSIRMEQHRSRPMVIWIGLSASQKAKTEKMGLAPRPSVNGTLPVAIKK